MSRHNLTNDQRKKELLEAKERLKKYMADTGERFQQMLTIVPPDTNGVMAGPLMAEPLLEEDVVYNDFMKAKE